jgi:hypothetical protein
MVDRVRGPEAAQALVSARAMARGPAKEAAPVPVVARETAVVPAREAGPATAPAKATVRESADSETADSAMAVLLGLAPAEARG